MKLKKFAVLLVCVMVLGLCGSAFAWGNRTGSRTGDAAVYGVVGGALAGGVAYWLAGAATVLCPPVGIAAGLGLLGAGTYGALVDEKTIASDATCIVAAPLAGVAAAKATNIAGWTLGVSGGAVLSVPFTKATEAVADEWKKPKQDDPVNVVDIPY